jgi:hypothetical protein
MNKGLTKRLSKNDVRPSRRLKNAALTVAITVTAGGLASLAPPALPSTIQ